MDWADWAEFQFVSVEDQMEAGLWININEDEDITEDEDNYIDYDVDINIYKEFGPVKMMILMKMGSEKRRLSLYDLIDGFTGNALYMW